MGRGSSGIGAGKETTKGNVSIGASSAEPAQPRKTLVSKEQVDTLTADYTPEKFLGDVSKWDDTMDGARWMAEDNMPASLEIGGYNFNKMGAPHVEWVSDGKLKNNVVVIMDYQSDEKVGNEYPVIQVAVRMRRYRGKVQTEIVRRDTSYTYGTKFW